jgi:hypothetical protein
MKKIILFAICAIFALVSKAQSNTEELKYLQDLIGIKKKQYVEEHVKIKDADAAKFWAIYDDYDLYRSEIGERRVVNINEYVKNYNSLTNEKADELMKASFAITNDLEKLLEKTYSRMAKDVSPVVAVQFVQVELYIEAMVRKALTDQVPGMSESAKKKK